MRAAALTLSVALGVLTACSYYTDRTEEQSRTHATPLRTGTGTIQSVGVLPRGRKDAPAATGGSRASDPNAYRLQLLMDSGGYQTVDVDNSSFMSGESVEILADGTVRRVSGTTLNFFGK